uniref:TIL domain-containing protein n=1 Tax=Steinernema glaseri TaxID=37863 RepID=A0A1I7YEW1_9BILA
MWPANFIFAIVVLCLTTEIRGQRQTTKVLSFESSTPITGGITCGPNEEATKCLPCEQECDTAIRNISTICVGQVCFDDGPQFCECPLSKGFARDYNGKCVPTSQCPIPGCSSGQECCMLPDCACKPDYVRFYEQCIPQALCPPKKRTPCGECPAGKVCKYRQGWFSWFFGYFEGRHFCEWYTPCEF